MNELLSITRFEGDYRFLSNYYNCEILYDGLGFRSVEAAFQAMKCQTHEERIPFESMNPRQARAAGRKVTLRPDWEQRKLVLMYTLVKQKFAVSPELREKLLTTGYADLVEGNRWHDNYWGSCDCPSCQSKPGQNNLGKILMRVRTELCIEYDRLSVELPNGYSLEAEADVETAYPGIYMTLIHPDGYRDVICFAEFNPNRLEGHEFCVAAYKDGLDDPVYHESYFGDGEEEPHG